MRTGFKLFLSAIAILLIFSGGLDFGLTTIPGVAMLAAIWGIKTTQ